MIMDLSSHVISLISLMKFGKCFLEMEKKQFDSPLEAVQPWDQIFEHAIGFWIPGQRIAAAC